MENGTFHVSNSHLIAVFFPFHQTQGYSYLQGSFAVEEQKIDAMNESSKSSNSSLSPSIEQPQLQPPHEALFLALTYLPVYELLIMAQVCKSLRNAVFDDLLPWMNLIVQRPLNSVVSDEILIKIASKAKGKLQSLALMNCIKITDEGLLNVVKQNPFINKLYIPACIGLTSEGVLRAVEMLCQPNHRLSILRINGIYAIQKAHLDTLASCLQKNPQSEQQKKQQPLYYHEHRDFSAFKHGESQRLIDLELCPKCSEVRMVYDCPKEKCKRRVWRFAQCRACSFCIQRCENCGGCIGRDELEVGACADILCLECWLQLPKCSFCYKPYCRKHTNWWCKSSDSGFTCIVCDQVLLEDMCNDVF